MSALFSKRNLLWLVLWLFATTRAAVADETGALTYDPAVTEDKSEMVAAAGKKPGGFKPPKQAKTQKSAKPAPKGKIKPEVVSKEKPKVKPKTATRAKALPKTVGHKVPQQLPKKIHDGKQALHSPGHKEYKPHLRKDVLNNKRSAQQLLNGVHSGKYKIVGWSERGGQQRPIVNFKTPVGHKHGNPNVTTKFGKIHYGKNGAHIVPYFRS